MRSAMFLAGFVIPLLLGGILALSGAAAIGKQSKPLYGMLAFVPIWLAAAVALLVVELFLLENR